MWEIRSNALFRQSPPNGDTTGPLKTALYVQVDPTGHAGSGYRFPLWGGHIISDIWGQHVFEDQALQKYRFRYEIDPHTIDIRPNTLSSRWENWEELLAKNQLVAYVGAGSEDVTSEVRTVLQSKMKADSDYGAALRWSIQARPGDEIYAVLQALPKSSSFLRREGRFTGDTCAAMELSAIRLTVSMNCDSPCRGPIPTLFARDVEKTKEALSTTPEALHTGKIYFILKTHFAQMRRPTASQGKLRKSYYGTCMDKLQQKPN
jgi:hypothetical protein